MLLNAGFVDAEPNASLQWISDRFFDRTVLKPVSNSIVYSEVVPIMLLALLATYSILRLRKAKSW